ncbi:MAG: hypothetical protein AAGA85_07510, partial [Bacteroidota bacterium]
SALDRRNLADAIEFFLKEGEGGGTMDFALNAIPKMYDTEDTWTEQMLFLVGPVAHNSSNFGNFLVGAAASSNGIPLPVVLGGGHANSMNLFNKASGKNFNGYPPQWDSQDDQRSITLGFFYLKYHSYHYK